jgi:16S rRNA (cytosine1402-N4)-methyltransferase
MISGPGIDAERWDSEYHAPVLVREVLDLLQGAQRVLDATLGGGGHSEALLDAGASVIALDRDQEAVEIACKRLDRFEKAGRFSAYTGNFARLDLIPEVEGIFFGGILADLGVSSHQIDDLGRGFSFREGARLDMRMGADATESAAQLLSRADEGELAYIFREWADERRALRLAREIVRRRQTRPLETSDDLVGAIRAVLGPRSGPSEFARLFQGIRIAVNDEMGVLDTALPLLRDRLEPGGVLVVIAYHSGEDRRVKHAFREWSAECTCPPRQLQCSCRGTALGETITRKAITAAEDEIARNPRSRSARLRAWRSAR